jgi:AraC-like DNA-binding protein
MSADVSASLHIDILQWGFTRCTTSWRFERVNSPFTRIYFVGGGGAYVVQENRRYDLTPGTLTAIPAHTTTDYRCDRFMDLYWMHVNAQLAGGVELFERLSPPRQVVPSDRSVVLALCRRFMEVADRKGLAAQMELDGIIRLLLARFCEGMSAELLEGSAGPLARFELVLRHIEENLGQRLAVSRLAALMHLQPVYFANLFSRHFGMGPAAFVLRRRVEKARQRLWHSPAKLSAIADELGFCDAFHLSKAFKQVTGMSPRAFRRQRREVQ